LYTSFRPSSVGNFFSQIHEGMVVYDSDSKRVGVVEFIKFTDESVFQQFTQRQLSNRVDETRVLHNEITPEGYVRIDGGFLAPDWVVLFDQIAEVSNDALMLNVGLHELISL
jgi:hypothetical protein